MFKNKLFLKGGIGTIIAIILCELPIILTMIGVGGLSKFIAHTEIVSISIVVIIWLVIGALYYKRKYKCKFPRECICYKVG